MLIILMPSNSGHSWPQ